MKKFYSLIAVIAASFTFAQTNLVQNPSFEDGLTSWAKGPIDSYTEPSILNDGKEGAKSAGYTNAENTTGFYQDVAIEAGKTYVLSFWYKATGDGTDARIWSFLKDAKGGNVFLWDSIDEDPFRTSNGYLPTATVWTEHKIEFTNTNAVSLQLALRSYKSSSTAYDAFSLVDKATLGVGDVVKTKYTLIANTIANDVLKFGADSKNVQIINANGQVVKTANVNNGSNLNVSSLAKGVYVVTGEVNGQQVSQKFVKK